MIERILGLLKTVVRAHWESYGKLGNWSTWIVSFLIAAGFLGLAMILFGV